MKKVAWLLWVIQILGWFYIVGGVKIHMMLVPNPPSELYFQNWLIGLTVGIYCIALLGLLVLLVKSPALALKTAESSFIFLLVMEVVSFMASTDAYEGTLLRPVQIVFLMPISLAALGVIMLFSYKKVS